MILLLALLLFAMCLCASIGEVLVEHDWPRETFRYVLMSAACVVAAGIF